MLMRELKKNSCQIELKSKMKIQKFKYIMIQIYHPRKMILSNKTNKNFKWKEKKIYNKFLNQNKINSFYKKLELKILSMISIILRENRLRETLNRK